jgi:zinc protease
VNTGLASAVGGALMPTQDPFVYTVSVTATEGVPLARVEEATLAALDRVRSEGLTAQELRKAKNQLRARLVFENDSITNIAHQLGYFETIDSWRFVAAVPERVEAVTLNEVAAAAERRLAPSNRTIGWFDPVS